MHLPGSRAAAQVGELAKCFTSSSVQGAIEALSAEPLQRRFFEDISGWFLETAQGRNELRHLIRVMFVWLLQLRGVVPDNALWNPGVNWQAKPQRYVHNHLEWLFDSILAVPSVDRAPEKCAWREELRRSVPFLNGSMFTPLSLEEKPEGLDNAMYLDINTGLFSILGRYDWTLNDQTGYSTESAIDSSMLGDLFERFVLITDGPRIEPGGNFKMPGGTYYTPQDIADEMVTDTLSGWVEKNGCVKGLHELFHPVPAEAAWNTWNKQRTQKVWAAISRVTVLDPCCGSGEFTVAILQALWRARKRLSDTGYVTAGRMEDIIECQLFAIDIHPLAVAIARFRLLIALVDERVRSLAEEKYISAPLPNLETRYIVANTLCINLSTQFVIGREDLEKGLADLSAIREMWTSAHTPEEKQWVIRRDQEAREAMQLNIVESGLVLFGLDLSWLERSFLSTSTKPAEADVRFLFPAHKGWDIVIGNPPYQTPRPADKKLGRALDYAGSSADLYLMFIEAGLEVLRPEGCLTLIVPHSIVFRRQSAYVAVRKKIMLKAGRIDIRTYDNGPQPAFPGLEWLKQRKGATNRQRVTILRVIKGAPSGRTASPKIYSRGIIRLSAETRLNTLRARGNPQLNPVWHDQWTQAPTPELAELLAAMKSSKTVVQNGRPVTISKTAMYFITCLPEESLDHQGRNNFCLPDGKSFWPWVGLYNSHLFMAYWLMVGDAFHVTAQVYQSVAQPPGWKNLDLLRETGSVMKELANPNIIAACRKDFKRRGKVFPNCDFHDHEQSRTLVARLDKLLLRAYGLTEEPLLEQMRTIRTGSAHEIAT